MGDTLDDVLIVGSDLLSIVGLFFPPVAIIAKIVGYAADAEPEAVKLIDEWKSTASANPPEQPLYPSDLMKAHAVIAVIEARRQSGRSGGYSPA